ncbi:MAG: glucarate dehydratase [Bacteroidetes bacterium]|nr:glucarate dehydratase [Bacteroidota bacterium]
MSGRPGPCIRELRVTPIATADPPLLNAAGLHAPYALRTIIEMVTDDGITGLSEVPGSAAVTGALQAAGPCLAGMDVFQLQHIRQRLQQQFGQEAPEARGLAPWDQRKLVHVFSAVEVACLDIIGKVVSRPVVDLLGGPMRDAVPYAAYLFYKPAGAGGTLGLGTDPQAAGWDLARQAAALDPAGIVGQAQAMCQAYGFQSIKLKGGVFEPQQEVEAVLALHEAFGDDVPLRIDPNGVWKKETAFRCGRMLKGHIEYLEDPVRGQTDMAELRKALGISLATNMCTTSFEEIPSSIRLGSEDIILSDHHFWGGLTASMHLAAICRTFGRSLSMHSNSHLGISLAAMTHLGAALPELEYALDTHYPWQSEEIIVGGRMSFQEGSLPVPSGPGLGVELDREALARLHENYLRCGLTRRDDEIEMQKWQPGWKFQAVRY